MIQNKSADQTRGADKLNETIIDNSAFGLTIERSGDSDPQVSLSPTSETHISTDDVQPVLKARTKMKAPNTSAVNTFPTTTSEKKKKSKKKAILDPNYRYRVAPKQVAINVNGPSELINGIKIEMYIPLVKWLAGKISAYLPPHVDREELVSEGFCGLMEAAYKYNADKGRFETFARNRICGSMQDWLRSIDRLPRSAREAMRKIETAESNLALELNRPPTMNELAKKLNVTTASLSKRKSRLDMEHTGVTVAMSYPKNQTYDSSKLSDDYTIGYSSTGSVESPISKEFSHAVVADIVSAVHSISERDKVFCVFSFLEGADIADLVILLNSNPARVKAAKGALSKVARMKIF
jgi:RNA polymerase sigma factor FliA